MGLNFNHAYFEVQIFEYMYVLVKGKKIIGEKNNISEVWKKEEKRDDKVKKIDWLIKREKEQIGNYRKRGRLVLSYEPGLVTKGNSKKNI